MRYIFYGLICICLVLNFTILIFVNWNSSFFLNYEITKFNTCGISENKVINTTLKYTSHPIRRICKCPINQKDNKRNNDWLPGKQLILFPKNLMPRETLKFKQSKINFFPRDRSLSKLLYFIAHEEKLFGVQIYEKQFFNLTEYRGVKCKKIHCSLCMQECRFEFDTDCGND